MSKGTIEKTKLKVKQISNLKRFIESKLDSDSCDNSLSITKIWADKNKFDFNDLIDILKSNGGFCDCEVVFNLPDNQDLVLDTSIEK